MWFQRKKIAAVHDDDLPDLLESLGVLHKLNDGKLVCPFCSLVLNIENIGAIYHSDEGIKLLCDTPQCLSSLKIEDHE